jgi:hypothetical protein
VAFNAELRCALIHPDIGLTDRGLIGAMAREALEDDPDIEALLVSIHTLHVMTHLGTGSTAAPRPGGWLTAAWTAARTAAWAAARAAWAAARTAAEAAAWTAAWTRQREKLLELLRGAPA